MGSVRYRKTRGVWMVDYIDATGRRQRQAIGPGKENKKLAQRVLKEREAEAQLGMLHLPPARTPTLEDSHTPMMKAPSRDETIRLAESCGRVGRRHRDRMALDYRPAESPLRGKRRREASVPVQRCECGCRVGSRRRLERAREREEQAQPSEPRDEDKLRKCPLNRRFH